MRLFFVILAALAISMSPRAQTNVAEESAAIQAMGAYVASADLERSLVFYRALFDRDPVIHLADFVAFDIEGGWFAIVSRNKYAPETVPGTGRFLIFSLVISKKFKRAWLVQLANQRLRSSSSRAFKFSRSKILTASWSSSS